MNGSMKIAALAALLTFATAYAEDPNQAEQPADPPAPADTTMATDTQWPEFSTLDTDGDGAISNEEARAQGLVASRFGELDGDKDGKLSSDEYKKGLDKTKAPNP